MYIQKLKAGLATALLFISAYPVVAQHAVLKLRWYPVADTVNNTIKVEVTNVSGGALPADNWAIYFNAPRMFRLAGNAQLTGTMLNGFLFRVNPGAGFKPVQPGQKIEFSLESKDRVRNVSDGPAGVYYINEKMDDRASVAVEIPTEEVEKFIRHSPGSFDTPQEIFTRNSRIKNIPSENLVKVFPRPAFYEEKKHNFIFSKNVVANADTVFSGEKKFLERSLQELGFVTGHQSKDRISLRFADMPDEGYRLTITEREIKIEAATNAGAFYGVQSLLTLLPPELAGKKVFELPEVSVIDTPRFHYRGIMLDVARNFQSKEQIKKVISVMALYKLNVLHFHLNDDEGWRLEIPGLNELTDVGSHRGHHTGIEGFLPPAFGSGFDTSKGAGNGHYSRADFIEILQFAHHRHVTVIPEIESPGHARAAIVSMAARYRKLKAQNNHRDATEYLLRIPDTAAPDSKAASWWNDNVMDIGLPSTYRFLDKVVSEIQLMYADAGIPLKTIHMGGDEVDPATMNYPSAGEGWLYFWTKIDSIFKEKGLALSGWEEMAKSTTGEGGTEPDLLNHKFANNNHTFDVWNNVVGQNADLMGYHLANEGFKIVLSCAKNNYFDMAYTRNFFESGYYWAAFIDLENTFSFVPDRYNVQILQDGLSKKDKLAFTQFGKSNIKGVKGLLWSEKISSAEQMEYKLFPRLLALAERAWSPDPAWINEPAYENSWSSFVHTLSKRELPRLDRFSGGAAYRIPSPGIQIINGLFNANFQLPGFELRYTTDGNEPNATSALYTKPFPFKGTVKIKAFNSSGRSGRSASITYKSN